MKNKVIKIILCISLVIILIDQISKIVVLKVLSNSIGNDYFGLVLVQNTGMAFGFNDGNVKNVFLTSIRMSWKVVVSSITLALIRLFS